MTSVHQPLKNVVVGFGKSSAVKMADFFCCIMDQFSLTDNSVHVNCDLSNNVLSMVSCQGQHNPPPGRILTEDMNLIGPVALEHSPECPLRQLSESDRLLLRNALPEKNHVVLAVAVLLESHDGKLLMTQRAAHMRSYPRAWVPPGGHLEKDEALITCGLRELQEETGILFHPNDINLHVLCMWESVYPPFQAFGSPRNHHVTIYLYAKSKETSKELMKKIKCDPTEVMAYTWFTPGTIQSLRSGKDEAMDVYLLDHDSPSGIKLISRQLSSMFRAGFFWTSGKLYSGTQQALTKWSQMHIGKSCCKM